MTHTEDYDFEDYDFEDNDFEDYDLDACPFCGSHNVSLEIRNGRNGLFTYVRCRNCYAQAKTAKLENEEDAVNAWNRRSLPMTMRELLSNPNESDPLAYALVVFSTYVLEKSHCWQRIGNYRWRSLDKSNPIIIDADSLAGLADTLSVILPTAEKELDINGLRKE